MARTPLIRSLLTVTASLTAITLLALPSGCTSLGLGSISSMMKPKTKFINEVGNDDQFRTDEQLDVYEPPMIGDHTNVSGTNVVVLEGIGLITGLPNTGGDHPASYERTRLLEDMRRRGVPNPNAILQSPSTALVIVRAYQPVLAKKGDQFDVEVKLPPGSEARSLNGGWLMECDLVEKMMVSDEKVLEGKTVARAQGPILVGLDAPGVNPNDGQLHPELVVGKIVGGATNIKDRDMSLFLNSDFRIGRNSERIAERIGTRFYDYNEHGHRVPLAEAKTDKKIVLNIHKSYKEDYGRYWRVIQNIAFKETEVEQRVRMERLKEDLHNPDKAEHACIQLEAIGEKTKSILYEGLKAPTLECRFYAAISLAYLGDTKGVDVLYEAAKDEPAFRVYALAAMAVTKDAEAMLALRRLLDEPSKETRFGAFRAMTVIDERDPFIRGEQMNDQFKLHVLDTKGEPMVHLTTILKPEVVLFGAEQKLITPVAIRAGKDILISGGASEQVITISRHHVGEQSQTRKVSTRLDDVIRTVIELGATFPDVALMLAQADRQHNLEARIGIDELPLAGRLYERPKQSGPFIDSNNISPTRAVGHLHNTPNMFQKGVLDENSTKPLASEPLLGINSDRSEKEKEEEEDQTPGFAKKSFLQGVSTKPKFEERPVDDEKSESKESKSSKSSSSSSSTTWGKARSILTGTSGPPSQSEPTSDSSK
ncbi:flagellar basal body P-ring protein FlgI [Lacunimicrobium album]